MKNANRVYEIVNTKVIDGLTKEGLSWFKPWCGAGGLDTPVNAVTGYAYNPINSWLLGAEARQNGYQYNEWITPKECIKQKLNFKGQKTSQVFTWFVNYYDDKGKKWTEAQIKKAGLNKADFKQYFAFSYHLVFNIDQVGLAPKWSKKVEAKDELDFEPHQKSDNVINTYVTRENLALTHGGNSAYYSPSEDRVNMPRKESFIDSDSYYKVMFHELAHSTGAKKRIGRKGITGTVKFGSVTYSKEELIAEISSMYCVHTLGLNPKDGDANSQAYIKGWCKYLKDNVKECTFAMTAASKAVKYIFTGKKS